MVTVSAIWLPMILAALPRINSSASGFFFCGMALLPVEYASGSRTKPCSVVANRMNSSAQRLRWTAIIESALTNSMVKSRSQVASMLLAVGRADSSLRLTRSRVDGSGSPRIRRLEMRMRGHDRRLRFFRARDQHFKEVGNDGAQLVDIFADEQPQIGGDLFVAAAAGVEFFAGLADQIDELLLHEVMDIFGLVIVQIAGVFLGVPRNSGETFDDPVPLLGGQNSALAQRVRVGAARRQFIEQQLLVKWKRSLPFFKLRIERLPNPAGPHLHLIASWRIRARDRAGRRRMRMTPAASF